ncbi:MAG: hypothetical protein A2Y87_08925 [Bacteroidetes bacterium RBG_13_46_8]|nr:MAG: hypothetical protein A2Y87_08925 [Bacteroidetes bacterium RBG_13_46_8]
MKTMHKIITLLLIVGMTGLVNTSAVAQLNEKFKKKAEQEQAEDKDKDKSGSVLDQVKDEAAPAEKKAPAKTQKEEKVEEVVVPDPVFTPQVYTYNHPTSVLAKETQLMKKGELKATVTDAEAKVTAAREKIAAAKDALEKNLKAKKIREAEYTKNMFKIMKAEKWVDDLELSVKKGNELIAE